MGPRELELRELEDDELDEANRIYARIDFAPSVRPRDRTFGASLRGVLVGLARINAYRDATEIGGFWTDPDSRGQGVATALLRHVIERVPDDRRCFCIPFAHLAGFYRAHGFRDVAAEDLVPTSILEKVAWCARQRQAGKYPPIALLTLARDATQLPPRE